MNVPFMSNRLLLLLFLFCQFLFENKVVSFSDKRSSKLDECRRCKVLTESFNHWLDKTSRGKFEGGDTAWEEAKLKSYTRSEIRLVEIQEGLCSELKSHQDPCYTLAEEAEQVLEQWWFNESTSSIDLYSWLCIETLQHCCPSSHFGISCSPCHLDKNNVVCSGNGKCDGDGTRKGNGTCLCKSGYVNQLCDECAHNFFETSTGSCFPCHESCNGCTDSGPSACKQCNSGWELVSGNCTDINECTGSVCISSQYCINLEGSFSCKDCDASCRTCRGEGTTNCTSCDVKHSLLSSVWVQDDMKQSILWNAYKRLALYIGLLIISYFVFHTSSSLGSVVILIIAIYIYISEKSYTFNLIDVLSDRHF